MSNFLLRDIDLNNVRINKCYVEEEVTKKRFK